MCTDSRLVSSQRWALQRRKFFPLLDDDGDDGGNEDDGSDGALAPPWHSISPGRVQLSAGHSSGGGGVCEHLENSAVGMMALALSIRSWPLMILPAPPLWLSDGASSMELTFQEATFPKRL